MPLPLIPHLALNHPNLVRTAGNIPKVSQRNITCEHGHWNVIDASCNYCDYCCPSTVPDWLIQNVDPTPLKDTHRNKTVLTDTFLCSPHSEFYSPSSWCGLHKFKCQEGYVLQGGTDLLLCNLGSWHKLTPADNYSAITG